MQSLRRSFVMAAGEVADTPTDAVQINCSVAGVVVLKMADGSLLPVQLAVGPVYREFAILGHVAAGSSGTFTVYGLGL